MDGLRWYISYVKKTFIILQWKHWIAETLRSPPLFYLKKKKHELDDFDSKRFNMLFIFNFLFFLSFIYFFTQHPSGSILKRLCFSLIALICSFELLRNWVWGKPCMIMNSKIDIFVRDWKSSKNMNYVFFFILIIYLFYYTLIIINSINIKKTNLWTCYGFTFLIFTSMMYFDFLSGWWIYA